MHCNIFKLRRKKIKIFDVRLPYQVHRNFLQVRHIFSKITLKNQDPIKEKSQDGRHVKGRKFLKLANQRRCSASNVSAVTACQPRTSLIFIGGSGRGSFVSKAQACAKGNREAFCRKNPGSCVDQACQKLNQHFGIYCSDNFVRNKVYDKLNKWFHFEKYLYSSTGSSAFFSSVATTLIRASEISRTFILTRQPIAVPELHYVCPTLAPTSMLDEDLIIAIE
uniref:Uncharacterized protein n=1 Tax=Romanomermis culicivorax TaxID=13658 RepID=A0A915HQH9_ROMCU